MKLIDILQNFALYKACGASIPKGLLLCGEPGVGKTMFAKAIASEIDATFFAISCSDIQSKGSGEPEKISKNCSKLPGHTIVP